MMNVLFNIIIILLTSQEYQKLIVQWRNPELVDPGLIITYFMKTNKISGIRKVFTYTCIERVSKVVRNLSKSEMI